MRPALRFRRLSSQSTSKRGVPRRVPPPASAPGAPARRRCGTGRHRRTAPLDALLPPLLRPGDLSPPRGSTDEEGGQAVSHGRPHGETVDVAVDVVLVATLGVGAHIQVVEPRHEAYPLQPQPQATPGGQRLRKGTDSISPSSRTPPHPARREWRCRSPRPRGAASTCSRAESPAAARIDHLHRLASTIDEPDLGDLHLERSPPIPRPHLGPVSGRVAASTVGRAPPPSANPAGVRRFCCSTSATA